MSQEENKLDFAGTPAEQAAAPRGGSKTSGSALIFVFMVLCAAIVAGLLTWIYAVQKPETLMRRGESRLPILGQVPPFELTNEQGGKVTLADLIGSVWIADFIFSRCGGTCPIMSQNLKTVQDSFARNPDLASVKLVSVSVDAERDTPDEMRKYSEAYGADPGRWMFLTGEREATQKLARDGFKLATIDGDPDSVEPIIHSQSFALVDRKGRIRGYYDGTNAGEVAKLMKHAREIIKEKE